MAAAPPRISPSELRTKLTNKANTLLVCAYRDPEQCRRHAIPGAITLRELEAKLPGLSKQQEIVLYCA